MTPRAMIEVPCFAALALMLHMAALGLTLHVPDIAAGAPAESKGPAALEAAGDELREIVDNWENPQIPPPQIALPDTPPEIDLPRINLPDPALVLPLTSPVLTAPEAMALAVSPRPVSRPARRHTAPAAQKTRPKATADTRRTQAAASSDQRGGGAATAARKGAGGTAGAVSGGSGLSRARENDLRASWGGQIRARIERRKTYPSSAGRAQGVVTVRLTVQRTGRLASVSVARSSGNAALDRAALQAVRRAGRFPAAPRGLGRASYSFTLPIRFAR